jgi:hypothetical protein
MVAQTLLRKRMKFRLLDWVEKVMLLEIIVEFVLRLLK